jgi:hypothetical protein
MVHEGMYRSYLTMESQMISSLRSLLFKHTTAGIIVTGHSLGGAQATYAAMAIKEKIKPGVPIYFYTFASPRTGNQAWSDYVMKTFPDYFRVTHTNDIVPTLPLESLVFNHAGTELWYYDDNHPADTFKTCTNKIGMKENTNCIDSNLVYYIEPHLWYLGVQINNQCTTAIEEPQAFLA